MTLESPELETVISALALFEKTKKRIKKNKMMRVIWTEYTPFHFFNQEKQVLKAKLIIVFHRCNLWGQLLYSRRRDYTTPRVLEKIRKWKLYNTPTMKNTIKCIHCGREIELSDALAHELAEETERIRKTTEDETRKRLTEEFAKREKERKLELEDEKKKNRELIEAFEKKKKEDEEKVREQSLKESSEKYRLEKLEWEKQKADMQKALEDAQRKAKQGSQQLQGEVLELDLEGQLKNQFPLDEFLPIPKGVEGADIWQNVRDERGNIAGSILWETKRTKNFDKKWLAKLREDTRRVNASECILVTEVLPPDVKSFHRIDGVWVSGYEYALHIARTVRFLLFKIAVTKNSVSHEDEELRTIYNYITSDSFRHKIEAHNEAVKTLRDDLFSEIRTTQTRWKKRETQIARLDSSISQLYGELQGIIPELEDIKSLPEGTEEIQ